MTPGQLLAGEYPGSHLPEEAAEKVGLLIDAGVDSIVDLTSPNDCLAPYLEQLKAGDRQIEHFAHPIPDMGVISQDGYDQIVERISTEIAAGRLLYVHCWGGRGRTSTVVGCLLIDDGLDYDATIARIAELRAGTRKARYPCPESWSQHQLLRDRVSRGR